jgi:hypothetical protein
MNRLVKLQLIGPVVVFLAILAAEMSAAALTRWPSSVFLWRANLEWFHAFQLSNYALNAYKQFNYSQLWVIAFPLGALAFCGITLKRPLLLATASNLSLVYASFVLYTGYFCDRPWHEASMSFVAVSVEPDFLVCFVIVSASLLSFSVSHLYYIREIRGGDR